MLKLSLKHRRNMSTHLYSIKSLQNNFTALLYLYEPLNYESNLMRNNHILFENDVVALAEEFRNRRSKKEVGRTNAELSNIEASSSIVIHYYDSML